MSLGSFEVVQRAMIQFISRVVANLLESVEGDFDIRRDANPGNNVRCLPNSGELRFNDKVVLLSKITPVLVSV